MAESGISCKVGICNRCNRPIVFSQKNERSIATVANTQLAQNATFGHGSLLVPCTFTMGSIYATAADFRHAQVVVALLGHRPTAGTLCSTNHVKYARVAKRTPVLLAQNASFAFQHLQQRLSVTMASTYATIASTLHVKEGVARHGPFEESIFSP